MTRKEGIFLFLLGLAVSLTAALLQPVPGYMDAEYYYVGARQIASGEGFWEPILWNYLDDPAGLPHPSHTYWMPLASLVAAAGMAVFGSNSFGAGRVGFVFLAACLPVMTGWLAGKTVESGVQQRFAVRLGGLLAAFPGFYLVYTTLTETFVLYMLLGSLLILALHQELTPALGGEFSNSRWFAAGLCTGLMHLARADGLLWLGAFGLLLMLRWAAEMRRERHWRWNGLAGGAAILLGYGMVMGAWYVRNLGLYGQWMPPGGSRALWLTDYDQTYQYPASQITFQAWLQSGWAAIGAARLNAVWLNFKNLLVVQGNIFLLPLMVVGAWRLRRQPWVKFAGGVYLLTLVVMTLVFPFAGSRGGFLHSGAAFQPLFWAMVPAGLLHLVEAGARLRNWNRKQARNTLGFGLVVLSMLISIGIFGVRVLGSDGQAWRASWDEAAAIGSALDGYQVPADEVIMVNNPPGFNAATGRPAIAIPNGSLENILLAANRYGAGYLVLEENSVAALRDLYQHPASLDGLVWLGTAGNGYLFKVQASW